MYSYEKHLQHAGWSAITLSALSLAASLQLALTFLGVSNAVHIGLPAALAALIAGCFSWPRKLLVDPVPVWALVAAGVGFGLALGAGAVQPESDSNIYSMLGLLALGLFFVHAYRDNAREPSPLGEGVRAITLEAMIWVGSLCLVTAFIIKAYVALIGLTVFVCGLSLVGLWYEALARHKEQAAGGPVSRITG